MTSPPCEVCRVRSGWLRVAVTRTTTGPGVALCCGPCGCILQAEGRGTPLEATP
jgi:hypothetical protein